MNDMDPLQAGAESRLQQLDDALDGGDDLTLPIDDAPAGRVAADEYGFHLEDADGGLHGDAGDDEPGEAAAGDDVAADALDVVSEAFNARDLDALLDVVAADGEAPGLLGYDRDNLPAAIQDLWQRRPTCCLTRGRVEREQVGVLWEHDGTQWWPVAVVHVDDVVDGQVGVLEFGDDPTLLEQVDVEPPDPELEEGARWAEWEDGADGDDGS